MPETTPKRIRRKAGYHHGSLREALIAAATRLVAKEGPAALSVREAARRAGVSHAAPYRHFPDVASLRAAVAEEGFRALRRAVEAASAPIEEPRARLAAGHRAYVRFGVENPGYYQVMFGPDLDYQRFPSLVEAGAAAYGTLVDALARIDAKTPLVAPPAEVAPAIWAIEHGLVSLGAGPLCDAPIEEMADRALAMALDGIVKRRARP